MRANRTVESRSAGSSGSRRATGRGSALAGARAGTRGGAPLTQQEASALYVRLQQHYNAPWETPLADQPAYRGALTGLLPYWDVPFTEFPGGIRLGDGPSPLEPEPGVVRVFVDPLNTDELTRRRREFQREPDGALPYARSSAPRSLVVDGRYQIKLTGEWFDPEKTLTAEQARVSVSRTRALEGFPYAIAEPSAAILGDYVAVHRALPTAEELDIREGDLWAPAHAFLSPSFAKSPEGEAMFRDFGGSPREWLERVLTPHLADLVFRSLVEQGMHFELHTQNLDILTSSSGRVLRIWVKDLPDVLDDPMLRIATGHEQRNDPSLRHPTRGYVDDERGWDSLSSLDWYARTLVQIPMVLRKDVPLIRPNNDLHPEDLGFYRQLRSELAQRFREHVPAEVLEPFKKSAHYRMLLGPADDDPMDYAPGVWFLKSMRWLLVATDLEARFHPSPEARDPLLKGGGQLLCNGPTRGILSRVFREDPVVRVGHYRGYPVAIERSHRGHFFLLRYS